MFGNRPVRHERLVSLDPGRAADGLGEEKLVSLIAMYTNAVGELAGTGDPEVAPLAWELLTLRAEMIGALSQVGPSRENGSAPIAESDV